MSDATQLDPKDQTILSLLQEDAWLTHAKIGEHVNLSPSAVQRRIERLREKGILTGAKATIAATALKKTLRVYLMLELHNDGAKKLQALERELKSHREVISLELLLGKFDILLTLDCDDTEHFSNFAMTVLNQNENIRHCWTLTRLKTLI